MAAGRPAAPEPGGDGLVVVGVVCTFALSGVLYVVSRTRG
jgi:hypothetical protein